MSCRYRQVSRQTRRWRAKVRLRRGCGRAHSAGAGHWAGAKGGASSRHTQVHILYGGKTHTAHIRPELGARGMRGSKPAGFSGVGERAARSLDRVSRRRGPRRAAGASLEQRDLLDDVRRVREHSRGNDAGEVVGEVVRRMEAAVGGAVAPALPA